MRVLVPSTTFPDAPALLRELLPRDEIVVGAGASGPVDVIVPLMSRIDAATMDRLQPRLIQQFGVGLEGVDRHAAAARGIPVANVPADGTGNADGVGEIALLHLLALTRAYDAGRAAVGQRRLGEPLGVALTGARVVVLGLGAVGRAVTARLRGFGCEIVGVGTRVGVDPASVGCDVYLPVDRLHDALPQAVALIVCCTLTDATRGLVGARALQAMGPGGLLVNVARGPVVDYSALLEELRAGRLAGAGLDVFWDEPIDPSDPLFEHNVSVSPHIGGVTTYAYRRIADGAVANIERLRRGETIHAAV